MTNHSTLHASVARSLDTWHAMVASRDLSSLRSITHADAIFRSPVAFTAYRGADALVLAISTVIQVFQDFTYHRTAVTEDGLNVVLEFSANVEGKALKGIDFIRFDEEGRILEFEVMVRPLNGLQALALEMGKRVGPEMSAFKTNP